VQVSDTNAADNAIQRKSEDLRVSKDRMDEALLQMETLDKQLQIAENNASGGEETLTAENRNSSYFNEDETPREGESAGVPLGQHDQHQSQTIILDENFKASSPTSDETPNQAIVTDTAISIQNSNEVESNTHSPSNSNKMMEDDRDTWHSLTPSYLGIFGEIEVPPSSFSKSYVGSSRGNGSGSGSGITTMSESQSTMYGSVGTDSIARNISLCSVPGRHRVGGVGVTRLLTLEEEERITDMLDERDEDMERYGMTLTEKEMNSEVDGRLYEFGISFDDHDDDDNNNNCDDDGGACDDGNSGVGDDGDNGANDGREENEKKAKDVEKTCDKHHTTSVRGGQHHRDPVLRELAKMRKLEERERNIDKALRALMRAPLQSVIRCSDDDCAQDIDGVVTAEEDADGTCSMISSTCSGRSILSASVTEKDVEQLVQCCREGLEAENIEIADRISIRWLLDSLVNRSGRKSLDGERESLHCEMKVDAFSQSSE